MTTNNGKNDEHATSDTSAQSECNGLLCEHIGCLAPATHVHEPWLKTFRDIPCCERHSKFYSTLGMRVDKITT